MTDDGSLDYRDFVRGAVSAGSTPNGVFAARVMWGTMHRIVDGLESCPRTRRDLDVLEDALGPLVLVHLLRCDVVGQAVSWARAEQTGYWQDGDLSSAQPRLALDQVKDLVKTINEHNQGWSDWFTAQSVEPYVMSYEDVVADPSRAVYGVLDRLGVKAPSQWRAEPRPGRQTDEVSADWVRRYRAAYG